tara:strand:+ start:282 stop:1616 length:1335 start_codon:yes stop_codon:yes gene_type:complete
MKPYFDGDMVHADSEEQAYAFMEGMKFKEKEYQQKKIKPIEIRLTEFDLCLERLFIGKEKVEFKNRLPMAREFAKDLSLRLSPQELQTRIWDARQKAGNIKEYSSSDIIQAPPFVWSWENLIMMSDTNLISASPKVGKTTLMIEMIGKWSRGVAGEYLGHKFIGECPKVILIGTDMPSARWMPLLHKFGLAEKVHDTGYKFLDPIIAYFPAERPLYLDDKGLSTISDLVEKNPKCLILLDSYAACLPQGIDEKSNYFSQPLCDLKEVTSPHGITNVAIHHSGTEGARTNDAVRASRGHSSLPAAVSQLIGMRWHNKEEDIEDNRIILHTKGRGDQGIQLVVEQHDSGFELKGTFREVMQDQKREKILSGLTERQQDVLQIAEEQKKDIEFITPTQLAAKTEFAEKTKVNLDICRRTLDQLVKKGFLTKEKGSNKKASELQYRLK